MRRAVLILALCTRSLAAFAADAAAPAELTVRPLLCIVDSRQPVCDVRFLVAWQGIETGYYCVSTDSDEQPLRCWPDAREGSLEDDREFSEDFSYRLNRDEEPAPLASVTVEVLRMDSDDRRRNRRTRHVWDVL